MVVPSTQFTLQKLCSGLKSVIAPQCSLPGFTSQSGQMGKLSGFCSGKSKGTFLSGTSGLSV